MLQRAVSRIDDTMLDALVARRDNVRADELIARARRRTGLVDFGGAPFEEALEIFLDACREEAELSLFGRLATRWDAVRFLSNLLRLHAEEVRTPGILEQPIELPMFVAGLPRSGTTFLNSLLAQDHTNHAP
jgi:hypothetical protein